MGWPLLGGVMDRGDEHAVAAQAVEDDVGSAADAEFAQAGLAGRVAKAGMKAERLDESDDAHGEPLGGTRFVECDVSADLAQASGGKRRPDNFETVRIF